MESEGDEIKSWQGSLNFSTLLSNIHTVLQSVLMCVLYVSGALVPPRNRRPYKTKCQTMLFKQLFEEDFSHHVKILPFGGIQKLRGPNFARFCPSTLESVILTYPHRVDSYKHFEYHLPFDHMEFLLIIDQPLFFYVVE